MADRAVGLAAALWPVFERHVFAAPTTERLFNPYRSEDPRFDVPGAPLMRRENLRAYLDALGTAPPVLLLAEAPGPNGARFSGVPLTSERQLLDPAFPYAGVPTSRDGPHGEYSAGILERASAGFRHRLFVWNAVPLHPHPPGAPLGIRTPTRAEVAAFGPLLRELLVVLRPARCLAVGRVAERALADLGAEATYLRHPSQGGARRFAEGLREVQAGVGEFPTKD